MKRTSHRQVPSLVQRGKKRIGKLKSAHDVAKYIARCIRQTEGGGDENRQYKLVTMASMLLKAIEVSYLEDRISALESVLQKKGEVI